jgi:hypothetical protein
MTYSESWESLAGRVRGLVQAGHLRSQYLMIRSDDNMILRKYLIEQCNSVVDEVNLFRSEFHSVLPTRIIRAIEQFDACAAELTKIKVTLKRRSSRSGHCWF